MSKPLLNPILNINALISHRFRGFSTHENTIAGLIAALDFGVQNLEFDIRIAACGTPMVYHDEYAFDRYGNKQKLCKHKANSYKSLGGTFSHMPTFDDLLHAVKNNKNHTARLLIDIKDFGFETAIHALVMAHRLINRTVYVSWLPDVLFRMHELTPNTPLCLSHWCQNIDTAIAKKHTVYVSKDGNIKRTQAEYIIGMRSGWSVTPPLQGKILEILRTSGGGICVPQSMLTRKLSDYYHRQNMFVSTFSYTDWEAINQHNDKLNIDMYFIDNKQVFEQLL